MVLGRDACSIQWDVSLLDHRWCSEILSSSDLLIQTVSITISTFEPLNVSLQALNYIHASIYQSIDKSLENSTSTPVHRMDYSELPHIELSVHPATLYPWFKRLEGGTLTFRITQRIDYFILALQLVLSPDHSCKYRPNHLFNCLSDRLYPTFRPTSAPPHFPTSPLATPEKRILRHPNA